ncbi:GNAT family N-acetyltransferase [Flavicella sediminum]|uniref:GNAT family N-acetyltransferase n=1 Tax=Flavicella sediminum TaxID=2585141 RepID=UPI0011209D51|nr:GNAT family N-acetyltransferase [Flavicella sediminum]
MTKPIIKIIPTKELVSIIPLLQQLNKTTPEHILKERLKDMSTQNYKCIGIYIDAKLVGISGLWFLTRHYIGKTVEPDHVVIDEAFRGQQLGKQLFEWIYNYAKEIGYEATELNAYTGNRKSHKFYLNEGYEIYGYHFIKVLRKDGEFY